MKMLVACLLLIFVISISSCIDKVKSTQLIVNPRQKALFLKLGEYGANKYKAPNELAKEEASKEFITSLGKYFSDSLKYHLENFRVQLDDIKIVDVGNQKAFYFEFKDEMNNKYWMEFDYPLEKDKDIYNNPTYKLIKNIPQNKDTILSFFYMGQTEWTDIYSDKVRIRAIPFPRDFNFDSAAVANNRVNK